jgi:ornithine carbamoyltransferase
LVHGAVHLGVQVVLCFPKGFGPGKETISSAKNTVVCIKDPYEAVRHADVIYTDTWISIGDESQTKKRLSAFASYQVNTGLFAAAPDHALFMHCLPAHPGQEVAPEVLRGPRSIVFDQAENRKHAQKALLAELAAH